MNHTIKSALKLMDGITREKTPQAEARLAICHACPILVRGQFVKTCGACGCVVAAKAKLPTEQCPMGLW